MASWDIARLRQIAGVQLNESYDDDDDDGLSKSERELASKAEGDLKKKGIKVGKVDPDKDIAKLATRRKASETKKETAADDEEKEAATKAKSEKEAAEKDAPKAEDKPEPKKEAPKAEEKKEESKAEEKKEEAAAEAKRRGKAPNPESFNQHAKANAKNMTRGQFLTWAAEKHGKGKAYSSALFAKYNPKSGRALPTEAKECFMISHPSLSSYFLHENKMMNQMQWVDLDSDNEPMIFESKAEADKVIQYMANWKGQVGSLVTIDLSE